jgi:hypothetical protein
MDGSSLKEWQSHWSVFNGVCGKDIIVIIFGLLDNKGDGNTIMNDKVTL